MDPARTLKLVTVYLVLGLRYEFFSKESNRWNYDVDALHDFIDDIYIKCVSSWQFSRELRTVNDEQHDYINEQIVTKSALTVQQEYFTSLIDLRETVLRYKRDFVRSFIRFHIRHNKWFYGEKCIALFSWLSSHLILVLM